MVKDDWAGYIGRVSDPQDKVLLEEAASAARGSAFRIAYLAVWLSCAESLKRKFKELSQLDHVAMKVISDITDKEAKQQATDRVLLTKAKQYGFISDAEFDQLESIYRQRCVYGHPYEQAPLLEQLIAAVASVVEFVLSRPTKLRHGYLARQVDLICTNREFLDDHLPAIDSYADVVYTRSSSELHLWFLQKLWREAAGFAANPSMSRMIRRVVWFSEAFLKRCDNGFFSKWNSVQDLSQYPLVSRALGSTALFCKLDGHSQDIVVGQLLKAANSHASCLKILEELDSAGQLTTRQRERFVAGVKLMDLHVAASSGLSLEYYVDGIIEALKSYNWYVQNPAVSAVAGIGSSGIVTLLPEKQKELGNNVLQAADGDAGSAVSLVKEIARGERMWPEAFVEGVITECFVNDGDKFRFKTKHAREALLGLCCIPTELRTAFVSRLVDRVRRSSPKHGRSMGEEHERILKIVDDVISGDKKAFGSFTALRDAVARLEVPKDE